MVFAITRDMYLPSSRRRRPDGLVVPAKAGTRRRLHRQRQTTLTSRLGGNDKVMGEKRCLHVASSSSPRKRRESGDRWRLRPFKPRRWIPASPTLPGMTDRNGCSASDKDLLAIAMSPSLMGPDPFVPRSARLQEALARLSSDNWAKNARACAAFSNVAPKNADSVGGTGASACLAEKRSA
jgi:hypothetical protein